MPERPPVKEKIGELLNKYAELRDSDTLLWLAYLNSEHQMRSIIGVDAYNKLKTILMAENTPSMETIRRARQRYQASGLYIGTKRKPILADDPETPSIELDLVKLEPEIGTKIDAMNAFKKTLEKLGIKKGKST